MKQPENPLKLSFELLEGGKLLDLSYLMMMGTKQQTREMKNY